MKTTKSQSNTTRAAPSTSFSKAEQLTSDVFYGMSFSRLRDETVISRSHDGTPISYLSDDRWFLPAFAFNVSDNVHFDFLPFYKPGSHREHNVQVCKKFFLMKMFSVNNKTGKPLRVPSMQAYINLLVTMAHYCSTHNIKIESIFEDFESFQAYYDTISDFYSRQLVALVRTFNKLSSAERGFNMDGGIFLFLQKEAKNSRKETQQFPIIPSRILLFKYHQYQSYLSDFLNHHEGITDLLHRAGENPLYAKSPNNHHSPNGRGKFATAAQLSAHKASPVLFKDAIHAHQLGFLHDKYKWNSIGNLIGFVSLGKL
ncbi:hypothetical protein [Pseudomonas syringae]|uniref:Uncharacterized protein n=1 Tax=Pseudomonas syringae pv. papulans TaxID=83963 RepID=A0A0Q0DAE3_PSESX|nr:hypothetical protein [Pseudomonas syringae]KPY35924.1 Uncharacterized protein ALO65_01480 [Pseudomonas syringae pv. papulans]KWS36213.1 hypothetical protein AL059_04845 [Pseudomonas syringae pv. papulans]MDH4604262.1 hypothetical protein [Pseudomonas syringae pv. papulans]MDH4621865.1 hypothetical protein [Pseudomonas syringae pv. papulans]RMN46676.1 hypothetical protein ALQ60_03809 [Pseudomonas syringae pv. papulans]